MAIIQTGSDLTIQLTINDVSGNPIDLDTSDNITVEIYQKKQNILASYSLADLEVVIISAIDGRANVYVNRSSLTAVTDGKLFAEVTVDITNSNFEDNVKRSIVSAIELGTIKVSV